MISVGLLLRLWVLVSSSFVEIRMRREANDFVNRREESSTGL